MPKKLKNGDDIRTERKRLGLSMEKLARLADVGLVSVSRWERGIVQPSKLVLRGLQGFLEDYRKERRRKNG